MMNTKGSVAFQEEDHRGNHEKGGRKNEFIQKDRKNCGSTIYYCDCLFFIGGSFCQPILGSPDYLDIARE
jgi:hypothetical protein